MYYGIGCSMPSLFVWKALPLTSTTLTPLSYYSGSNWFLEEHSTYSKSAMYLNQRALSNQGCVYDIKWMPTNWVGSHLLENASVPYALLKEDALGRLEQLGDWMRFTTYREVDDKEAEWERIQEWVLTPLKMEQPVTAFVKPFVKPFIAKDTYEPCLINLSAGNLSAVQPSLPIYSRPHQQQYRQRHQPHHQPRQQPYQKKRISA